MVRHILLTTCLVLGAWSLSSCTTIAWEAVDKGSEVAAEEESPAQEAQEGPLEHGVEEAGKVTQKGVQKVEQAKEEAVEEVKDAFD